MSRRREYAFDPASVMRPSSRAVHIQLHPRDVREECEAFIKDLKRQRCLLTMRKDDLVGDQMRQVNQMLSDAERKLCDAGNKMRRRDLSIEETERAVKHSEDTTRRLGKLVQAVDREIESGRLSAYDRTEVDQCKSAIEALPEYQAANEKRVLRFMMEEVQIRLRTARVRQPCVPAEEFLRRLQEDLREHKLALFNRKRLQVRRRVYREHLSRQVKNQTQKCSNYDKMAEKLRARYKDILRLIRQYQDLISTMVQALRTMNHQLIPLSEVRKREHQRHNDDLLQLTAQTLKESKKLAAKMEKTAKEYRLKPRLQVSPVPQQPQPAGPSTKQSDGRRQLNTDMRAQARSDSKVQPSPSLNVQPSLDSEVQPLLNSKALPTPVSKVLSVPCSKVLSVPGSKAQFTSSSRLEPTHSSKAPLTSNSKLQSPSSSKEQLPTSRRQSTSGSKELLSPTLRIHPAPDSKAQSSPDYSRRQSVESRSSDYGQPGQFLIIRRNQAVMPKSGFSGFKKQ